MTVTSSNSVFFITSLPWSNSELTPVRLNNHWARCSRFLLAAFHRRSIVLAVCLLGLLKQSGELAPNINHPAICSNKGWRNKVNDLGEPLVREYSDQHTPRQTESSNNDGDSPLNTIETVGVDIENAVTNKDDGDLESDHDAVDEDEEQVAVDADKDVKLVVEASAVEFVEDLHPDEDVEDDGVELELFGLEAGVVVKDGAAGEVENEDNDQLEDGLTDDHLPHL